MPVSELILYTTLGCHLCEQAAELLQQVQIEQDLQITPVDIADDEKLVDMYGIRIPVIRNEAKAAEIGWPFQIEDILSLLD